MSARLADKTPTRREKLLDSITRATKRVVNSWRTPIALDPKRVVEPPTTPAQIHRRPGQLYRKIIGQRRESAIAVDVLNVMTGRS